MATPAAKALGSSPEPFDGKAEKADAFWNTLENYYYLNETLYADDNKKVSSALTYFKLGTPAGEWAQDRQKTALAAHPISFGTWNAFRADFKKHFIPAHTKLEATNAMYTSKMGNRHFNEWYQEWSTHASRSGANEETKMFAFRKALPQPLHQKIIGVSPQPTTLEGLVDKAREFDQVWHIYNRPAFTGNRQSRGPSNRAMIAEDDGTQVNATTTTRPQMGKLSKEEKDRRSREKLCFYCGKPNHTAKECRAKTNQMRQNNFKPRTPRQDTRVRAAATQEEGYEEAPQEHPAQISAMYHEPRPRFSIPRPHSAPVNEDF
jgi:Retrotransposon gag protein/Zinc knuckle